MARIHDIDMESWYIHGLLVYAWTHGIYKTHGMDLDSWYRIGTYESHHTRGPSVARMQENYRHALYNRIKKICVELTSPCLTFEHHL